jgi:hypothetical protein
MLYTFLFLIADASSQPASTPVPMPITVENLDHMADKGLTIMVPGIDLGGSIGFVLRPRLDVPLIEGTSPRFSMSMIRPAIRAFAWDKRIKIFIQPEFADTARILDAEGSVALFPFFGVRAGRYVTSFSRSFITPVPRLKFPDFASSNVFMRVDRDIGGSAFGKFAMFDYEIGAFSGTPTLPNPIDRSKILGLARLNAKVIGDVTYDENRCRYGDCPLTLGVGANAAYHVYEAIDPTTKFEIGEESRLTTGYDMIFTWKRVLVQAEFYYRARYIANNGGRDDSLGGYVMASVTILPRWLEATFRFDALDPSQRTAGDKSINLDALLTSYVLGEHAKIWLDYTAHLSEAATTSHRLTLELQFWI